MINRLSRRGFLGVMSVVPVLTPVVASTAHRYRYEDQGDHIETAIAHAEASDKASETEVLTPSADGSQRVLRGAAGLRLMHKAVNRHLRDLDLRLVGQAESNVGSMWGSGVFTNVVYLKLPHAERSYDPLSFESLAAQFAERIRAEGLLRIGRLAALNGVHQSLICDDKRRLAMRYIEYYEIRVGGFIGRFDVLGGPA